MDRRQFLMAMGAASTALLASSCKPKGGRRTALPYLVPPEEEIIPGVPFYTASTSTDCPGLSGVIVKSYDSGPVRANLRLKPVLPSTSLKPVALSPSASSITKSRKGCAASVFCPSTWVP